MSETCKAKGGLPDVAGHHVEDPRQVPANSSLCFPLGLHSFLPLSCPPLRRHCRATLPAALDKELSQD